MPNVIVKGMEMPSGCVNCPLNYDATCNVIPFGRPDETNGMKRRDDCPLEEELPLDKITLREAIEGPAVWAVVAAAEPERNIAVQMTYADLVALAKMIQNRKGGKE